MARFKAGRVVAIAGPGSGKTATVVERIRRLADSDDYRSIAAMTFTVRAAAELENRLAARGAAVGYAGTLHGFARWLLLAFPDADGALGPRFSVLDERDRLDVTRSLQKTLRLRTPPLRLAAILEELHHVGADPEALPQAVSPETLDAGRFAKAYRAAKARLVAEDFDGLIDRARIVLMRNPGAAAEVQRRFRHVSVDEAQDLDGAQAALLELVAPEDSFPPIDDVGRSLLLVGDPMQSVYEWRGGDPRILLGYAERAHLRAMLGTNFRSVPRIVELANRVAADDPLRPPEYRLDAARDDEHPCPVAAYRALGSDDQEADDLAHSIAEGLKGGVQVPRDFAVLARTNRVLERVGTALDRYAIPYQRLGARKDRLEAPLVRGALSFAEAAVNPANDHAVERALSTPAAGLDQGFFSRLSRAAAGGSSWSALHPSKLAEWTASDVERRHCLDVVERVAVLTPERDGTFRHPCGWSGALDDVLEKIAADVGAEGLTSSARDIGWVRELLGEYVAGRVPGRRRGPSSLSGFLWWIMFQQGPGEHDPEANAVTLSTVHLAKGLEWPTVIVAGMTEGGFPTARAIQDGFTDPASTSLAQERRVFFVACSRAADALCLSTSDTVTGFSGIPERASPSRFLRYLAPQATTGR